MSEELENLKQAQAARRENLARWRAQRVHKLPTPLPMSGMEVWLRDVTMTDLMLTGKLPDPMVELMEKAQLSGKQDIDLKEVTRNGEEFRVMLDTLVTLCVVEPPIGLTADEDHISVDELAADDKMAIFRWVNREAEQMRPFREAGVPVETALPGGNVRAEAEPGDGAGNGDRAVDAGRVDAEGGQASGEVAE